MLNQMTPADKIKAVQQSDVMVNAVKMLIATFEDLELKSYIRLSYTHGGKNYELTFLPIGYQETYEQSQEPAETSTENQIKDHSDE